MRLVQFLEGCQQNVYSGESRPSDKRGGGGHPDPEIRGGGRSQKNFFRPLGPQFGLKIRVGGGIHSSPGSATGLIVNLQSLTLASTGHKHGSKYEYLILLKSLSQFLVLIDYLRTYLNNLVILIRDPKTMATWYYYYYIYYY